MIKLLEKFPNLSLAAALAAVLALCTFLNTSVYELREADRFYRWIVSASTQMRIFGVPGHVPPGQDPTAFVDTELFEKLVSQTEPLLDEIEITDHDRNPDGEPYPKIVRYTAAPLDPESESSDSKTGAIESELQLERDRQLWRIAQDSELASLRSEFMSSYRNGRVASLGSTFGLEGMYADRGTTINLANMFFGFRKMAANLLWLEVDKLFHKGTFYRMIPMMKTCVTLDPTFIDAYLLGAWHMAYNATYQLPETPYEIREFSPEYNAWVGEKEDFYFAAVEFLKDGIRKNPRDYKLYFDLAFAIYEAKLNDLPSAIRYNSEAIRLDHDRWVRRQLYRELGEVGRLEESKAGWQSYLEKQPDNAVAKQFVKRMDGAILERSAQWAATRADVAESLAKSAAERGDATAAAEWEGLARAAQDESARLYADAKAFWKEIVDASGGEDTQALARMLMIEAEEFRANDRYVEAVVWLDRARWASNLLWDEATHRIIEYRREGNLPLYDTELKQIERENVQFDYIRHLPQAIAGRVYTFDSGTWRQEGSRNVSPKPIQEGTDEVLKLIWDHPEIATALEKLDGNIVFRAGDDWYEYRSLEPAIADKLYDPTAGRGPAEAIPDSPPTG